MTSPAEAGLNSAPYKGLSSPDCMAALGRVLDADPAVGERAAHTQNIVHRSPFVNADRPIPWSTHSRAVELSENDRAAVVEVHLLRSLSVLDSADRTVFL